MRSKKILLIVVGLALLVACVLLLSLRRDKPVAPSVEETSRSIGGPAFDVLVERPLFSDRPPWEIPGLWLRGGDRGPRLTQSSPGATVGNIAPNHLELSAEGGWNLLVETDGEGRLAPTTHLAFPIKLGGRPLKFDCRSADRPKGYLDATARPGSGELDGSFMLELPICKNAVSGKTAAWPSSPLIVRGNFAGLALVRP